MDVWYVDNLSIWLDIKIMTTTVFKVLLREATVEDGEVADFWGTQGPPPGGRLAYPAEQDETHLLERSRPHAIAPPIERPVR